MLEESAFTAAFCLQDEDELDSHTMVKTSSGSVGTTRATSTMSEGAQTMIEHSSTMLESDLGTMVINSEDEEEEDGTMKSMWLFPRDCRSSVFRVCFYRNQDSSVLLVIARCGKFCFLTLFNSLKRNATNELTEQRETRRLSR